MPETTVQPPEQAQPLAPVPAPLIFHVVMFHESWPTMPSSSFAHIDGAMEYIAGLLSACSEDVLGEVVVKVFQGTELKVSAPSRSIMLGVESIDHVIASDTGKFVPVTPPTK